ncbi:MAG: DNA polymerase III subunit alpha [Bacteroidetes bacterium]|nr:DNA polymerase III subunit alpha [Bacteroidota bacterium]
MYLNAHSYYSLRYGTLAIDKLVKLAVERNIRALALTDINNSTGMVDFVRICKENRIKPIGGVEFRNGNEFLYTGIALNNEGMRELNEFVTWHNLNKTNYPDRPKTFKDAYLVYPFRGKQTIQAQENEFIGIRQSDLLKLYSSDFSKDHSHLLIHHPVTFGDEKGYMLHQNLRAVDNNILLSKLKPEMLAHTSEWMMDIDQLLKPFRDYPQIIKNTEKLLEDCSINYNYKTFKNKKTFTGNKGDDQKLLTKLAYEGLHYRYGKNNQEALRRVKSELNIIFNLGFASYFLITWDIIRYSMSRGFYHVGRGSGANSVVAYCLKITDVDPIDLDLYFERFINPRRTSPPDFDIDYSWREREEVQDYIFKRYGEKHTALLGATSTFKGKSIFRELGKVYGLPKQEIDELVDNPETEVHKNEITRNIYEISKELLDFPNLRSIHAGGILISEEPLSYYTALDLPPKGFPTTQWDMYVAEDIGFEKLDILSQRGIGHIRDAAEIILQNRGIKVDVHEVDKFKNDKKVQGQLKKGETIGCFYIESPAMRGLLKKLRCDNYLSLVAASSIIRPGVAKSGMMRQYIHRFHHPNDFEYLHPIMKEQLEETYGVMVYQEDVIKVCHHFAGLDLADADVLRRAMSGKFRGHEEMKRIVDKFFSNCKERGYPDQLTHEIWRQIDSFAGYSFSKAHSASYAVESFQSLFLKAYFPLEFMTAVINNFGGFYHTWVYFNEARRQGAHIKLPCVNNSTYATRIIGKDIYVGFVHIVNLEYKVSRRIEEERNRNGDFVDLEDFIRRIPIGIEQLIILIKIDAFRYTGSTKQELLWESHMFLTKEKKSVQNALFYSKPKTFTLPQLETSLIENAYDEIELIGFPVTLTHFDMLQTSFRGEILAKNMIRYVGKKVRMVGNLVTIKYVKTVKKEWMHFGTFLDATGEFFDTVHFPKSLQNYPFKGKGVYLILGEVTEEFDFPSLTVEKMAKLPLKPDPREA